MNLNTVRDLWHKVFQLGLPGLAGFQLTVQTEDTTLFIGLFAPGDGRAVSGLWTFTCQIFQGETVCWQTHESTRVLVIEAGIAMMKVRLAQEAPGIVKTKTP